MRPSSLKPQPGKPGLKNPSAGFTLIEMAVVTIILGLLFAGMTPLYFRYIKQEKVETTNTNIQLLANAIGAYRSQYARYPCPGSLATPRDNPAYGREQCGGLFAVPPGQCTADGGLCIKESLRSIAFSNPELLPAIEANPAPREPRIRIGFLPFRQLGLEESQAYDGYGNRILYAVTENLLYADTFTVDGGGIEIRGENNVSLLGNPASVHFLILGHGENGAGAYNREGARTACPVNNTETINTLCNVAANADAIFNTVRTSANNATGFDDELFYFTHDEIPLWQYSSAVPIDIHPRVLGARVGVGMEVDDPIDELSDVEGILRATTTASSAGFIQADELCTGADCFPVRVIEGRLDQGGGLECPGPLDPLDAVYMQGIVSEQPICTDEIIVQCAAGEYVTGINTDGSLQCTAAPPANCNPEIVTICNDPYNLPARLHGQQFTVVTNDMRNQTYQCNDGTWSAVAPFLACNCVPVPPYPNVRPCPYGYTGNIDETCEHVCPADQTICNAVGPDVCVCDPITESGTDMCPPGFNAGEILWERTHICPPGGSWTPRSEINNCRCVEEVDNEHNACPPGMTGTGNNYTNSFVCPGGANAPGHWTGLVFQNGDCHCDPSSTPLPDRQCPPGMTGSITVQRVCTCPNDGQPPVCSDVETNNCVAGSCTWRRQSGGNLGNNGVGPAENSACVCGAAPRTCHSRIGPNSYLNFFNPRCICE